MLWLFLFSQYALEQSRAGGGTATVATVKAIGADEFLPIHMFVVVRARLENPLLLWALLHKMCEETVLQVSE